MRRFSNLERIDHVLIFRFDAPLFFANIERFREVLTEYKSQRIDPVHTIIIDMESNNSIDSSALELFSTIIDDLIKENTRLLLAEVKGPIRDKMYKSGLTQKLGEDHFFVTVEDALNHVAGLKREHAASIALQTNAFKE
jgi:SulP family sulfate permease